MKVRVTREFIMRGQTGNGGWTKKQLGLIGVSWPPQKGWIDQSIGKEIEPLSADLFLKHGNERQLDLLQLAELRECGV